jgi:hypothetical protein
LQNDIAREHDADLVLGLQRAVGELRVARTEDTIGSPLDAEFRLERRADVDVGQNAEPFLLQGCGDFFDRVLNGTRMVFAM